ncbi:MAG: response regulator [Candidatus Omnitrophica bacterium]|nr:response regulator [Candidatus Omnitrophota bacterium]
MKKKIIIIDDEVKFVQNVKTYFAMHGYTCLTASTGKEGLAKIEKERPVLMILDILMPNMDGYTMLQEVRKRHIPIRCIITTGKRLMKELFEREAIDHFLEKPFMLDTLKDVVDEILEQEETSPQPSEKPKTT